MKVCIALLNPNHVVFIESIIWELKRRQIPYTIAVDRHRLDDYRRNKVLTASDSELTPVDIPDELIHLKNIRSSFRFLKQLNYDRVYFQRQINRIGVKSKYALELFSRSPTFLRRNISKVVLLLMNLPIFSISFLNLFPMVINLKRSSITHLIIIGGESHKSAIECLAIPCKFFAIKTFLYTRSLDNLNSKGTPTWFASRVFVLNIYQRDFLQENRLVPSRRISVVGSTYHDRLYRDIKDYSVCNGMQSKFNYLLYLGSSANILKHEPRYLAKMLENLDLPGDTEIWVRPHPTNIDVWKSFGLENFPRQVRVLSQVSEVSEMRFDSFADLACGAISAFGINTSAFMDVAALGVFVGAVDASSFGAKQENTTHFKFLLDSGMPFYRKLQDFVDDSLTLHNVGLESMGVIKEPPSGAWISKVLPMPGQAGTKIVAEMSTFG